MNKIIFLLLSVFSFPVFAGFDFNNINIHNLGQQEILLLIILAVFILGGFLGGVIVFLAVYLKNKNQSKYISQPHDSSAFNDSADNSNKKDKLTVASITGSSSSSKMRTFSDLYNNPTFSAFYKKLNVKLEPDELKNSYIDPIAEADIYLTYQRRDQAGEVLRNGLELEPDRLDLHLKYLQFLHEEKNKIEFVKIYEKFKDKFASSPSYSKVSSRIEKMLKDIS